MRTIVINLDRRPYRRAEFYAGLPADLPFPRPERLPAIDAREHAPPDWWKVRRGAWGCYLSHLLAIEQTLSPPPLTPHSALPTPHCDDLLIFEDDAVFAPDFASRAREFFAAVPDDWDMIYLGGQHIRQSIGRPKRINPLVLRGNNINRLHAYAIRGRFLSPLYQHLLATPFKQAHHVDHHIGILHETKRCNVYCPPTWLVGQRRGRGDIRPDELPERWW